MRLVFKRKQKQNVTTAAIVNFFSLSLSRVCCLGIEPRRIDRKCNLASQQKQKHITHLHPHATHTHTTTNTTVANAVVVAVVVVVAAAALRLCSLLQNKNRIFYDISYTIWQHIFCHTHTHTESEQKQLGKIAKRFL